MGQPLDKSTAAFYGKFVNAAYAMFKRDRNNRQPEPEPGDIPAPYEMVAWINMTDFFGPFKDTRFYGLIAQNTEIPHEYIVAIRGTEGLVEWWDDATSFLVPFRQVPGAGRVHQGFDKIYSSMHIIRRLRPAERVAATPPARTFIGSFGDQLEGLTVGLEVSRKAARDEKRGRPLRTYVVTGHSLGSALATLFVMENDEKKKFDVTTCCTFASPRVGNKKFCHRFDRLPITSWRIVNSRDVVPKVPLWIPLFFGYRHVETAYKFSCRGMVKCKLTCWHSMGTYLHWLDGDLDVDPECKP